MSIPDLSGPALKGYKNQGEIIRLTADQVVKDFALFGLSINFSGNTFTAYNELFEQLNLSITTLLVNDYNKLISLLYHIDISEKELNRKTGISDPDFTGTVTEMILDREFRKVVTRLYFSM